MARDRTDLFTRALAALGRSGRVGRELGVRLDLLRSVGGSYALRRVHEDAVFRRFGEAARHEVYKGIWLEAARELHAEAIELPGGFLELRKGNAWTRVWQQFVALDDPVALRFVLDKALVYRVLAAAGIPITEYREFSVRERSIALDFLTTASPCVIKPAHGAGAGSGVTTGIQRASDLERAILRASRAADRLLIERQVPGDVYRLLFLDGELLDVIRRLPPRVIGDGRSSIRQLIASENRKRLDAGGPAGLWPLKVDIDAILTLKASGLTLGQVPERGAVIVVKHATNQNRPEDNLTVREPLADALVAEAAAAADAVGLRLAGVDIVASELGRSLRESGGVVLEVNSPGLHHHYHVADGERATRVAIPILRKLLD